MASLTAEAPDPKTFKSWEGAFSYPVPVVRRMQQQLRGGISANRERLRTLVGASYRDLLGTADTIVQMDRQMQEVEINLSDTSRRCNASRLEKSYRNSSKLVMESQASGREIFANASLLYVLQRCPDVVARILRKGDSIQLAAKVLVVSRLLHKKLEDQKLAPEYVAAAWDKLTKLRQKVPTIIDRRLANTKLETSELIDAMCAYSLATSSSSALDVLRHFHRVRLNALTSIIKQGSSDQTQMLDALQLWICTLQDTRTLFPKQLANALAKLKSIPILKDKEVLSIWECDFEVHGPWLGEDVQNFTPYLRHDDLSVAVAAQQLSIWAPVALKALLQTISAAMVTSNDLKWVVNLRQACFEALFSHYHIPGVRSELVFRAFREVFAAKLLSLVQQRCESLESVSKEIASILHSEVFHRESRAQTQLWSRPLLSMSTAYGAKRFTQALHSRIQGETDSVRAIIAGYTSWLLGIGEVEDMIASMRITKWEDYLDDVDDDSDDEDDELSLKNTRVLLSETDPESLSKEVLIHSREAIDSFCSIICNLANSIMENDKAQDMSAFLLRVLREVKLHLPKALKDKRLELPFIFGLHTAIASPVVTSIVSRHSSFIVKSLRRKSPIGRALWDGTPELPVLPSPWAFQLVRDLQDEMTQLGTDIWTPTAIAVMKNLLRLALTATFVDTNFDEQEKSHSPAPATSDEEDEAQPSPQKSATSSPQAEETNFSGEASAAIPDGRKLTPHQKAFSPSQDVAIQHLFDLTFLAALAEGNESDEGSGRSSKNPSDNDDGGDEEAQEGRAIAEQALATFRSKLKHRSGLDAALLDHNRASAEEYRKRTALLFALAN